MPIKKSQWEKTKSPGIYRVGPNRYLVRVRWTDPKTGRREKREVLARSYNAAVEKQRELRGRQRLTARERLRFADCAERWLAERANELAPSTRERYVGELASLIGVLGEHFVDAIEASDIKRWRDLMCGRKLAPSTVNAHLRTLRAVMGWAASEGLARHNVAQDVRSLPEGRTRGARGTALTPPEFRRFVDTVEHMGGKDLSEDVGRMLLTAAWTGVRKGELLALKWSHLQGEELFVCEAVCKVTRRAKVTKTDDPRRVPIPEPLRAVLREQRRWLVETQHPGLESDLIFPASPSYALAAKVRRQSENLCWYRSDSTLDKPLRAVVERGGLPRISMHSLRRTYENLLRQAGVDQLVRRSLAGWRSESAQAIYAGVSPSERRTAMGDVVRLVEAGTPDGTPEAELEVRREFALERTAQDL